MLAPLGANFGNIVTAVYWGILRETKTKGSQAASRKLPVACSTIRVGLARTCQCSGK
jgi:hypothetical protein